MIKIIAPRHRETASRWVHTFTLKGESHGNGYSFPTLPNGDYDTNDEHYSCWKESLEWCKANPDKIDDDGVEEEKWSWMEPLKGECKCGEILYVEGDTECPNCGQWYNGFGQELKNPEYWYED